MTTHRADPQFVSLGEGIHSLMEDLVRGMEVRRRAALLEQQAPLPTAWEVHIPGLWLAPQPREPRRDIDQRDATALAATRWALRGQYGDLTPSLPLAIALVRVSTTPLDRQVLVFVLTAPRLAIAEWLGVPGDDRRVRWCYRQELGQPGLRITFARRSER